MKRAISSLAITVALAAALGATSPANAGPGAVKPGKEARFSNVLATSSDTFVPEGTDKSYPMVSWYNPILPGFYPDPSIVRVKDDYYLINSSFAYYPGIPVFHSKDLMHWEQIGNAIDRPDMLDFSGLATSRGVFAPDISYHDGLFYIVNTCVDCKGNFVITAKDPKGPWSNPVWLDFDGIDPSLFWDDDGKAYLVSNGPPEGTPLYDGHRALWLQGFDPATQTLTGSRQIIVNGGTDITQKPVWIEGPHILKKDGFYYLIAAQGGTEVNHSEVVFRSDKPFGPYAPFAGNPILTQRDLDQNRANPVDATGHADLVQAADGQWWSVFLGTRPYAEQGPGQEGLFNTGRETFLLPVTWKDGWPIILPQGQAVPRTGVLPGTVTSNTYINTMHSGYNHRGSALAWLQVRTPKTPFFTVEGDDSLILKPLDEAIGDVTSHPAFMGLRQEQPNGQFNVQLTYRPKAEGDRAGIVAMQSDDFYLFYGLAMRDGKEVLEITRRSGPQDPTEGVTIASIPMRPGQDRLSLIMDYKGGVAKFTYRLPDAFSDRASQLGMIVMSSTNDAPPLAQDVDVTNLSSAKAGGFVGTIIGLYAYGKKP